jgi:two-component system, LuxR family, response regulator FixJ
MNKQTVILVDDDQSVRESLEWMLREEQLRVDAYPSPKNLLLEYDADKPGCLVLDLRLPEMSGIELHDQLVERGCRHPFIIMTGHGEVLDATQAMRSGAVDFIEKPLDRKLFLARVYEALERDKLQRSEHLRRRDLEFRLTKLTPREREVLTLVVEGLLTKQIAGQLGISIKTVEVHRSNITKKMGVESVVQLVRLCSDHLLLDNSSIRESS